MAKEPVQRRWASSDPHFGHRLVARLRGFEPPDGGSEPAMTLIHDEVVITNWNDRVAENDLAFLLGDLGIPRGDAGMEYIWQCIDRLNGHIVLIPGNHDAVHPMHRDSWKHQKEWQRHFTAIQPYVKLRLEGEEVLLSHHPYTGDRGPDRQKQYRLRDEGLTIVHGHTHKPGIISRTEKGTLQIHAGLDAWNLKPVPVEAIMKIMREEKAAA